MSNNGRIIIDGRGFVIVDGIKLPCKMLPDGALQFCAKDKRIIAKRGSRFVEITPGELEAVDKIRSTS
jgi:hypothetical protein